jgi:hypothetical protein
VAEVDCAAQDEAQGLHGAEHGAGVVAVGAHLVGELSERDWVEPVDAHTAELGQHVEAQRTLGLLDRGAAVRAAALGADRAVPHAV